MGRRVGFGFMCGLLLAAAVGCSPRVLWVGIDSGNWAVLDPLIEAGYVPTLEHLVRHGVRAELDCEPALPSFACFCPPVWMSSFTGQPFAVHKIGQMDDRPNERRSATVWNVLAAHGGRSSLLGLHNSWPPAQEVNASVILTEYGAEYLAREHAGIYAFGVTDGGAVAEDRPETWTKPAFLYETLGMDRVWPECTNDNHSMGKDRISMRMLKRLAEEKARQEWWERTPELDVILLHSPDKNTHWSWGALQPQAGDPVVIDESVLLAQAEANDGNVCLPPPFQFGQAADDIMEIDRWLGELLDILEYDYVVLTSDHAMSRNPDPGGFPLGLHNSPEAFGGIFVMYGPGTVREGVDLGRISVHDAAPNVAYALGLPIARDGAGAFIAEIFSEAMLRLPPAFVPTWAVYSPY